MVADGATLEVLHAGAMGLPGCVAQSDEGRPETGSQLEVLLAQNWHYSGQRLKCSVQLASTAGRRRLQGAINGAMRRWRHTAARLVRRQVLLKQLPLRPN